MANDGLDNLQGGGFVEGHGSKGGVGGGAIPCASTSEHELPHTPGPKRWWNGGGGVEVDRLFHKVDPSHHVSLSWIPGHKRFQGNEEADFLAKEAVTRPIIIHSTVSWALEHAKSCSLKLWQRDWLRLPHTNQAAIMLHKPPAEFHKEYGGPCHVHTHIIQAILGHRFFGAYYQFFLPNLPTSCPCGTEDIQSHLHILSESPLHEEHHHTLRTASQDLSLPIILGTYKGLEALAEFIAASDAFRKA
ncbi:hypothetical protein BU17DRAFT_102325 [Hysterangium stoloniferum]|nr:hypothetical protein BU17DRAFT_102325 [Hysterangium stoloniferum]